MVGVVAIGVWLDRGSVEVGNIECVVVVPPPRFRVAGLEVKGVKYTCTGVARDTRMQSNRT